MFTASIARATLARARGEPRGVLAAFAPILGDGRRALPMATTLAWWPPIIAATVDVGDTAAAQAQLDRLRAATEERGLDLEAQTAGLAATSPSAAATHRRAAAGFARAIALAGPDVKVLDRADMHHRYGRLLVGTGRRRDGTEQLQRAGALLAGAEPFRARVEADLAAAGLRPPRHAPRSPRRAHRPRARRRGPHRQRDEQPGGRGGALRQRKAVEYHLGNVYAKLGIRSRRELRDLLRERQPQEN